MSDGIRYIEGFEGDEDMLVLQDVALTRSGDHARSGDYGVGKTGLGYATAESPLFANTTSIIVGFAFRWRPTGFGGSVPILALHGPGDNAHVILSIDSQETLVVSTPNESGGFGVRAYSTPRTLDSGAWYYIEIGAILDPSNGRVVVQLNGPAGAVGSTGAEVIDVSGIRTVLPGMTAPQLFYNQFHFGVLGGFLNESRDFSFDDFYVRELSEGFLGDQAVIGRALEDDRSVDFVRLSGSKNYQMVDEIAPDEDTTYNETDEDQAEDIFEVADTSFSGTIHAVQLVARAKKTQTQIWTLETLIDLGGIKTYGDLYYIPFPDYETLPPAVFGDAPGETGWTLAQLNAIGVGYRAGSPLAGS